MSIQGRACTVNASMNMSQLFEFATMVGICTCGTQRKMTGDLAAHLLAPHAAHLVAAFAVHGLLALYSRGRLSFMPRGSQTNVVCSFSPSVHAQEKFVDGRNN